MIINQGDAMKSEYSTISIRVRNEIKNVLDSTVEGLGVKSYRVLEEMLLSSFFALYSSLIRDRLQDRENEIISLENQINTDAEKLTTLIDADRIKEFLAPQEFILAGLKGKAEVLKELSEIITKLEIDADPVLPVLNLMDQRSTRAAVDNLVSVYLYKKNPSFRKSMDMNGMIPDASKDDEE